MTALLEDALELKVDKWGTLNTAASPQRLPEGHSPNNQNVWTDEKPGSVVTANGYTFLGTIPSGNPPTFGIDFFRTSDGSSRFVVSDGQTVWYTTDYVTYTSIITGLSPFFQLRGAVIRDKLWLTNGADSVRVWDGTTVTVLDGTAGTPDVPKGKYIAFHDERVWLYGIDGDLSSLRFTALADSSGTEIPPTDAVAWPTDNEIQISEGDADIGTGMWLYRGYLYCSKQFSIWRIVGSDEYDYTRVKTRASTGTRFQESVQIKDNLVHFVGVDGGYVFDGEEAKRITDIIDPSSPDEGVFAFRNLQQSLLNNQFWNVSETADFATGTVPSNLSTANDELTLIPADDSQADFAAGTHSDTTATDNPGDLTLALASSGGYVIASTGKGASLLDAVGVAVVGISSYITDGNVAAFSGFRNTTHNNNMYWVIDLGSAITIGRVRIREFYAENYAGSNVIEVLDARVECSNNGVSWTNAGSVLSSIPAVTSHVAGGGRLVVHSTAWKSIEPTDLDISFARAAFRFWRFRLNANEGAYFVNTEVEVYDAGYQAIGTFISKAIDFGTAPSTFGALAAYLTDNGEAYQFSTQSSDDGTTWDALVNVAIGSAIGSTPRRYLRWRVVLNSSTGVNTPVIHYVYVGSTYLSEIHNTGGSIFQWAAFQMSAKKAGETINAYYRAASTLVGVSAASWVAIVPGAVPSAATTDQYIQVKIELSTTNRLNAPSIQSFTINWILSNGLGINTTQNIASVVWLNRYWLSAATIGATANDIVIVLGKSTFGSPWHRKDFSILMFCRYQNILIGGSSTDGSLYKLETGYSKNGAAMDSFYETADLSKDVFQMKGLELLVTADRSGPYSLSVGWSTDGGLTYTERSMDLTRATGDSLSKTKKFNVYWLSDFIRFRVRMNAADRPFSVDELVSFYRPSPQRGEIE